MAKIQTATEISDNLSELRERLMELEENLQGKLKNKILEAEKKIEHKVGEKPLQSLATAFGAGVVIGAVAGALMRKRH